MDREFLQQACLATIGLGSSCPRDQRPHLRAAAELIFSDGSICPESGVRPRNKQYGKWIRPAGGFPVPMMGSSNCCHAKKAPPRAARCIEESRGEDEGLEGAERSLQLS
jgi:hypothetical protein